MSSQIAGTFGTDGPKPTVTEIFVDAYQDCMNRLKQIAEIIERADQQLLASDGPAGDQPPPISLADWKEIYRLTQFEGQ